MFLSSCWPPHTSVQQKSIWKVYSFQVHFHSVNIPQEGFQSCVETWTTSCRSVVKKKPWLSKKRSWSWPLSLDYKAIDSLQTLHRRKTMSFVTLFWSRLNVWSSFQHPVWCKPVWGGCDVVLMSLVSEFAAVWIAIKTKIKAPIL